MVIVEAIRLAIEKVGIDHLNGAAVRDALVNIKDFDTGLLPPGSMSEDKPWLSDYFAMYQVQQGTLVPVSEWMQVPVSYPLPE